ncbi:MAG: DUF3343 domain-containing protein [Clostridia bacterium]|nr:DUF3343 domain-containing protein [Clostridia bacterium]
MTFCIAVFRSRNETLYLANMLKSLGVQTGIINTPKEAGQACGISVRFDERLLFKVKQCLSSKPFRAFAGFYRITQTSGRIKVERIV